MAKDRIFNFSAGPSTLPLPVLDKAVSELINYKGTGMSVMEMSHRSAEYLEIFKDVKDRLRSVMQIPQTHEILFLHGGATLQFASVPMNLMGENGVADYAITGNFSNTAAKEAKKYGTVNIAVSSEDKKHSYIPSQDQIVETDGAKYFHYCANNTIFGTEWNYIPETKSPLVCDMSSNILSRPVDVSKYGIIYAGAQKNMGIAGVAAVIIDKSLVGNEFCNTPKLMNYKHLIEKDSMDNTPPCYAIYMLGLVLQWIEGQGGIEVIEKKKAAKAQILYDVIDNSNMYKGFAEKDARSHMNVTFTTGDSELDGKFVKEAAAEGFVNLKGHRALGAMRASIYNAMTDVGVIKLADFMKKFEIKNN